MKIIQNLFLFVFEPFNLLYTILDFINLNKIKQQWIALAVAEELERTLIVVK